MAPSKSKVLPAVPDLPPELASCQVYYERTRLHLRRFLAYLKPWEARAAAASRGLTASAEEIAAPSNIDGHVIRLLVQDGYAAERAANLASITERLQQPLPALASPAWQPESVGTRFARLQERLRLSAVETDLLWLLLFPELVPEFLWLYRSIWGDTSQVASQDDFLLHVLDPFGVGQAAIRSCFSPQSKLFRLLLVEEVAVSGSRGERYFRVGRRLAEQLLGLSRLDGELDGLCTLTEQTWRLEALAVDPTLAGQLRQLLGEQAEAAWSDPASARSAVFHLYGPPQVGKRTLAAALALSLGRPLLRLHLPTWVSREGTLTLLLRARREAFLTHALVCLEEAELLTDERHRHLLQPLAAFLGTQAEPVFVTATARLDSLRGMTQEFVPLELKVPGSEAREAIWRQLLDACGMPQAADVQPRELARKYNLPPGRIRGAIEEGCTLARLRGAGNSVTQGDLVRATTNQLTHNLSSVADRVEKSLDWHDLILPDDCMRTLKEIVRRYRHERQVMEVWGFRAKYVYGTGISVLFTGPPGTGKTMTAGILARELDMELFRIDLSRIVSKWIGETEKNLANVFDEGRASQAIILFDEADSLFGRRGEVRTSVDRYSNLEVNYLLQRMESYEGISILTTNQSQSMDEAFMRRITFKVNFPFPDEKTRERLWKSMIPPQAALAPDVNFRLLAEKFEFSGGYVKNTLLRAAFLAAEARTPISMRLVVKAAIDEARVLGRLLRVEDLLSELGYGPDLEDQPAKKSGAAGRGAAGKSGRTPAKGRRNEE